MVAASQLDYFSCHRRNLSVILTGQIEARRSFHSRIVTNLWYFKMRSTMVI